MVSTIEADSTLELPRELHDFLIELSRRRGVSLSQLVREACEHEYWPVPPRDRRRAVDALERMALPVASPAELKRQSEPAPHTWLQ